MIFKQLVGMLLPHVPKDGDLPLHEAARNGHVAVAHELLRRACRVQHCNTMWISCRARVPVDAVSRSGKTALHVACTWGQEAVVEAFRTTVSGERARETPGISSPEVGRSSCSVTTRSRDSLGCGAAP